MQTTTTCNSILVVGGTGSVGRKVVNWLEKKDSNLNIRVGGRDNEKFKSLGFGNNCKFSNFDFHDSTSWDVSLENVDRVFLIALPLDPCPDHAMNSFINKCRERKVKKIVFVSVINSEQTPLFKIEEAIRNSGITFVILRPPFFDENLSEGFMREDVMKGTLRAPVGDHSVSWISTSDIGECSATVLMENKFDNQTIDITGPKALNFRELSQILSKQLGRDIQYQDVKPDDFKKCVMDKGLSETSANYLNDLYNAVRTDKSCKVSNYVKDITGHDARSFDSFVQETFTSSQTSVKPGM